MHCETELSFSFLPFFCISFVCADGVDYRRLDTRTQSKRHLLASRNRPLIRPWPLLTLSCRPFLLRLGFCGYSFAHSEKILRREKTNASEDGSSDFLKANEGKKQGTLPKTFPRMKIEHRRKHRFLKHFMGKAKKDAKTRLNKKKL